MLDEAITLILDCTLVAERQHKAESIGEAIIQKAEKSAIIFYRSRTLAGTHGREAQLEPAKKARARQLV